MYFAQEYISLVPAVLISAGVAVLIIGVRAMTLMRFDLALFGVVVPAAAILKRVAKNRVAASKGSTSGIRE